MEWLRWHHGSATDPKFRVIARRAAETVPGVRVSDVLAVWAMLLERASAADDRGSIDGFNPEDADINLDLPDGAALAIVQAMAARGLLAGVTPCNATPDQVTPGNANENHDPEAICGRVANWAKRQPKRERDDPSSARVKAFREREKVKDVDDLQNVTPCNARKRQETPGNAQIRLEKRREEKKNISPPCSPPPCESAGPALIPERQAPEKPEPDSGFEEFWRLYPWKVKKAKAREAWGRAVQEAPPGVIIGALRRQMDGQAFVGLDGRVAPPHPTTWLNQQRWEDEVLERGEAMPRASPASAREQEREDAIARLQAARREQEGTCQV